MPLFVYQDLVRHAGATRCIPASPFERRFHRLLGGRSTTTATSTPIRNDAHNRRLLTASAERFVMSGCNRLLKRPYKLDGVVHLSG